MIIRVLIKNNKRVICPWSVFSIPSQLSLDAVLDGIKKGELLFFKLFLPSGICLLGMESRIDLVQGISVVVGKYD